MRDIVPRGLRHRTLVRVRDLLRDTPGITVKATAEILALTPAAARMHLDALATAGAARTLKHDDMTRYYAVPGPSDAEATVIAVVREGSIRRILQALDEAGPAHKDSLMRQAECSLNTLRSATSRTRSLGLTDTVEVAASGDTLHRLTEIGKETLRRYPQSALTSLDAGDDP